MLESEATVVTPSSLLAQIASHNFALDSLAKGHQSWRRPDIYSLGAWLRVCWQRARYAGSDIPALLSSTQEHALWQRIIEEQTPGLFDVESTATLASRTSGVLAEWHIPLEGEAWDEHEDALQFRRWLAKFRNTCKQEGWISSSDLWRFVPRWIAAGSCSDTSVVFAGFPNSTPALSRVREALGSAAHALGIERRIPAACIPAQRRNDLAEEIETAARWARSAVERNPKSSLGIFVPGLATHRGTVERIFGRIFYPEDTVLRPHSPRREPESVFHLGAAKPLRDHPIVAGALLLLQIANARIPIDAAGAILRSPWITGATEERNGRALADFDLRRSRELDVSARDLEYRAKACPQFQNVLYRVRGVTRDMPVEAEFADWSEFFSDILAAAGWPGDADLTVEEQDIVEIWKSKLSTLASLTLVLGQATYHDALARFRSLLDESGPAVGDFFSPIHILDASQAAGIRFDRAFVVGVSEENNFVEGLSLPLIPLKLQRTREIPGALASSLYNAREQVLNDLFSAAPEVNASYSKRILPASQKYLSAETNDWPIWQGQTSRQSLVAAELEQLEDTNAPDYRPGNRSLGGTGLIKDQSQCPFRAFALRRLSARLPEEGSFGLDSLDRGRFVHDALQYVWDELKTQDGLRKIAPLELRFLIHDAVKSALPTREKGPLHQQLSLAEIDRLEEVVLAWLEVERERKQTFEVEVTEQKRVLEIAGLHLDIRIDRIDRLRNGKCLLIDYKSGETSAANLNKERPREPQLLAYAAAMRDEVDGVFFAQLKPRDAQLVGYGRDVHTAGQKPVGKSVNWDEYLEDRIAVVERLAESFVAGEAAVDPLPGACQYCDLAPMCRVNELRCGKNENSLDD